jgi:xanthine/uracil/vitamin C permease (AzgA family)
LLLALPLAPLAAGTVATRRGRTGSAGRRTALLSAIVTGLVLFLTLAGDTLATAGGPYDPGQIRDFPGSRFPDIATYAVSDNLGTAMSLLLLASTVTAVLGCAAATIAARFRRATPAP